ncbi:MAG: ABC transporter ATP-binding protein [Dehalococcoidia bacterium]
MVSTVIETKGLTKRYGDVVAVNDLSFSVESGGVFGLLGPNGSGKTTTMGMLLGLARPTSGAMRLFGQDTQDSHRQALHRIGAIVETPAFYPYLSGRDNLRYFQGIMRKGSPAEIDHLLKLVDLSGRAGSKFSTYSLGMKQRLGIAYALLGDPELVFLDEPTNGLDPAGMAEVRDLIRDLGTGDRTVLLSSHLLNEVEQVCDRVTILSKGRLIANGRVQDLLRQRSMVRLKTTDDERAAAILAALEWVGGVERENGYLMVPSEPERTWELTSTLAAEQIYVSELTPVHVSLEQYFLEITGEPAPVEAPSTEAQA